MRYIPSGPSATMNVLATWPSTRRRGRETLGGAVLLGVALPALGTDGNLRLAAALTGAGFVVFWLVFRESWAPHQQVGPGGGIRDLFDGVVQCARWLAFVGDRAYLATLHLNRWLNAIRARLDSGWSLDFACLMERGTRISIK